MQISRPTVTLPILGYSSSIVTEVPITNVRTLTDQIFLSNLRTWCRRFEVAHDMLMLVTFWTEAVDLPLLSKCLDNRDDSFSIVSDHEKTLYMWESGISEARGVRTSASEWNVRTLSFFDRKSLTLFCINVFTISDLATDIKHGARQDCVVVWLLTASNGESIT